MRVLIFYLAFSFIRALIVSGHSFAWQQQYDVLLASVSMNSMNSDMSEQPAADGPMVAYDAGPVHHMEESASGGSTMGFFFFVWLVLLILIALLAYVLVECRCREKQKQQQQQEEVPETHHVEVAEPVVAVESRSRKINNGIGLTILFLGCFIGLGLSIFSTVTCEFVTLDSAVTLDDFYVDQLLSITIYNLGLWKVDLTSNSALSGCVKNSDILPFFDTTYKFAKASSILGVMFGGLGPLILMCFLMKPSGHGRHILVCLSLLAVLFQLTTLTLFGSVYCTHTPLMFEESGSNCSASIGAIASISAALYWMLQAVAAACLPFSNT